MAKRVRKGATLVTLFAPIAVAARVALVSLVALVMLGAPVSVVPWVTLVALVALV